jgi:hypothetical protein
VHQVAAEGEVIEPIALRRRPALYDRLKQFRIMLYPFRWAGGV